MDLALIFASFHSFQLWPLVALACFRKDGTARVAFRLPAGASRNHMYLVGGRMECKVRLVSLSSSPYFLDNLVEAGIEVMPKWTALPERTYRASINGFALALYSGFP